jgi:hypothetical protein
MLNRACAATAALACVLGGAAVAATPAYAATISSCDFAVAGDVYTLTADCEVTAAIDVPDGVTVDGDGHTITAVEAPDQAWAGGSVLRSAVGTAVAPATLNVRNLHIDTNFTTAGRSKNSGGTLNGILMLRAGGTIQNMTVDGISHGNGVQEGNGIVVRNRDLSASGVAQVALPAAAVTITDTTITRYQKTGLLLDGNLAFDVSGVTVGRGAGPNGETNDGIAANAVQFSRGAHGSLTDSRIALNHYSGADSATGILAWNAGEVRLERNLVTGTKGDAGVYVAGDGSWGAATDVTLSCTLVELTGTAPAGSVGVAKYADASILVVSDTTVRGFETALDGVEPTASGDCLAPEPRVRALTGDHAVEVFWHAAAAPAYAPVSGRTVVLRAPGEVDRTATVTEADDSVVFDGLTGGVTYTATVGVANAAGTATGTASVTLPADQTNPDQAQKLTLKANRKKVAVGGTVVFTGTTSPSRPGITVELRTKVNSHWRPVGTAVVQADGSFRFTWKSEKPLGLRHFRVASATGDGYLAGLSACRHVKVKA